MKKHVYNIFILLLIMGCASKKAVVETVVVDKPKADWMISPPNDPNYYVGIGMVDKTIEQKNYPTTSKQRAIEDLAASIKIKISSNSVLYQMEQSSSYKESYSSLIKSSTNLDLEGYELVDVWENEREYWTYYRLSKSVYLEFQEKKKQEATDKAFNHYTLATQYENSNHIDLALKNYLDALFVLKEYLGEQVIIKIEDSEKDLNSTLYQGLQHCLSNINLVTPNAFVKHKISSDNPLTVPISVENKQGTVSNLFVETTYLSNDQFDNTSKKKETLKSSGDGICRFVYSDFAKKPASQSIKFILDIAQIPINENDEKLKNAVYSSFIVPEKLVDVQLLMPKVFLSLDEKNIYETLSNTGVGTYISNGLTKEGIDIVDSKNTADFEVEVISNTEMSGESNGIYSARLNTTIKVKNNSGHVIYQKSLTGIRGSQLTYKKAGLEAYKNAEKEIKFKLMKELLKELL